MGGAQRRLEERHRIVLVMCFRLSRTETVSVLRFTLLQIRLSKLTKARQLVSF